MQFHHAHARAAGLARRGGGAQKAVKTAAFALRLHPLVKTLAAALLLAAAPLALSAQIEVSIERDQPALGEAFNVVFKVTGEQDGEPDFAPLRRDFQILETAQASATTVTNGRVERSKTYTLTLAPLRAGALAIPPIRFGRDSSRALKVQAQARPAERAVLLRVEATPPRPYVQQQLVLALKIYHREEMRGSLTPVRFEGVEVSPLKQLGRQRNYSERYQGEDYRIAELRYVVFPQASGALVIPPIQLTARTARGAKVVNSEPLTLQVRPVPAAFTGRHWIVAEDLQLRQEWSVQPGEVTAGEPVTRAIILSATGAGAGQLPALTPGEPAGLKVYADQPVTEEQTTEQGVTTTRTRKYALIAAAAGSLRLPRIEVPWWNSKTERMAIAVLDPVELQVRPAPAAQITAAATPATTAAAPPPAAEDATTRRLLGVSIALNIALALLACAAFAAWWNARRPPPAAEHADAPAGLREARARLTQACRGNRPQAVKNALLRWAAWVWPEHPPRSLEAIASRVEPPLAAELTRLSRHLYIAHTHAEGDDWNADAIARQAVRVTISARKPTPARRQVLQPLYRL